MSSVKPVRHSSGSSGRLVSHTNTSPLYSPPAGTGTCNRTDPSRLRECPVSQASNWVLPALPDIAPRWPTHSQPLPNSSPSQQAQPHLALGHFSLGGSQGNRTCRPGVSQPWGPDCQGQDGCLVPAAAGPDPWASLEEGDRCQQHSPAMCDGCVGWNARHMMALGTSTTADGCRGFRPRRSRFQVHT